MSRISYNKLNSKRIALANSTLQRLQDHILFHYPEDVFMVEIADKIWEVRKAFAIVLSRFGDKKEE